MDLSILIPAFNESQRIAAPLRAIDRHLSESGLDAEIIVVDDGSRDDTCAVVREAAAGLEHPLCLASYTPNRGKGFALKVGFSLAQGERILFTDADLSTPIAHASEFLAALDEGCDVAIGSRKTTGSDISVRQPWLREKLGAGFTWIVRSLIADVSDATCGFKAFRRNAGQAAFSRSRIPDWSFDAEILMISRLAGNRLCEIPVRWHDERGSKVRLGRDVLRSLLGLARIRFHAARGDYDRPVGHGAELTLWRSGEAPPALRACSEAS